MATLSGTKTVTAAGTAERLSSDLLVNGPILIKALTTNTGLVYIGNVNGDVDSTTGLPLQAGEIILLNNVGNLAEVWVDSAVNAEGVAWLRMDF
jgi:hypothetical protein